MSQAKITIEIIQKMKLDGQPIAALTAYDFTMARLLDEAGIPLLLVGDSVGMVVLGYPDTTHVTMPEMLHHVRAAARAQTRALLGADLPFQSYQTPAQALDNARALAEAGAGFVKAEGGAEILPQIKAIISEGIPFCAHLGMLPQHVLEEGGYKIKGKKEEEHLRLLQDARMLDEAGAFAIILELVTPNVAREIAHGVSVPVIGIGSGPQCDGQILVTQDLIGGFPWFTPGFIKPRAQCAALAVSAIHAWKASLSVPGGDSSVVS